MAATIREIADAIHVLNYPYLNQNIGVIVGRDEVAVIDTRSSGGQGREILEDVRRITHLPVRTVIDTHGHSDHAFGNVVFRPATIWGQRGCPAFMARTGEPGRVGAMADLPDEADEIRDLVLDPPDRLVDERETIYVGGREVELLFLGRGHTDSDLVIRVPDAAIAFAGDLVTNTPAPFFGDSYPLDWPATVAEIGALSWEILVTGHGALADREFLVFHDARLRSVVTAAHRAHDADLPWQDVIDEVTIPRPRSEAAVIRALAQLAGTL